MPPDGWAAFLLHHAESASGLLMKGDYTRNQPSGRLLVLRVPHTLRVRLRGVPKLMSICVIVCRKSAKFFSLRSFFLDVAIYWLDLA
jgi:hypothetical protein